MTQNCITIRKVNSDIVEMPKSYSYHVASGTAEWITALSFLSFLLSMAWELKDHRVHSVKLVDEHTQVEFKQRNENTKIVFT
ncbi:unnamed protein product [Heterobilharzia americana]|nr:unnamed protein product [Heterobilharzia americana]